MWRAGQNYVNGETLASDQEPFQVEKLRLFSETQGSKLTPKPGTSAFNIYTSTSLKTKSNQKQLKTEPTSVQKSYWYDVNSFYI